LDIRLPTFMRWLARRSDLEVCRRLRRQLLEYLAPTFDQCTWVRGCSTDPFDAPVFQGAGRVRHLPTALRDAVVSAAADGSLGRSGRAVCTALQRFALGKGTFAAKSANKFHQKWVEGYKRQCAIQLAPGSFHTFHVSMDCTRLGKKEACLAVVSCVEAGVAAVLPPIAPGTWVSRLGTTAGGQKWT
jgi:hypothetical protein